jgi:hypothetical protein
MQVFSSSKFHHEEVAEHNGNFTFARKYTKQMLLEL